MQPFHSPAPPFQKPQAGTRSARLNLLEALRSTVPIPPIAGRATPATSAPPTAEAISSRVTTLIPFRNLFWAMKLGVRSRPRNLGVGPLPGKPGDGLLPRNLGFATNSGYARRHVQVAVVRS